MEVEVTCACISDAVAVCICNICVRIANQRRNHLGEADVERGARHDAVLVLNHHDVQGAALGVPEEVPRKSAWHLRNLYFFRGGGEREGRERGKAAETNKRKRAKSGRGRAMQLHKSFTHSWYGITCRHIYRERTRLAHPWPLRAPT